MSRTFRQWVLFITACVAIGFMGYTLFPSRGETADDVRNQLRMAVDFTVLPKVLPEEPAPPDMPTDGPEVDTETGPRPTPEAEQAPEPIPAPAPSTEPTPAPVQAPAAAHTGTITSISLDNTPLGFTIKALSDTTFDTVTSLNLSDPARLVIDLHGDLRYRGKNVIRSTGAVKHIVIGEHSGMLRLVVYFNTPPTKKLQPQFKQTGKELFVTVPLP